jgi:cellulose synthase (UDP-forming)
MLTAQNDTAALSCAPDLDGALPAPESRAKRRAIRLTAVAALALSVAYLWWRVTATLGAGLWLSIPVWLLELHATGSLALFVFSLWDLDRQPVPVPVQDTKLKVAVLIATYNEQVEVLLPTGAAAVALQPHHETWVLDDGDRDWVRDLAAELGARYLRRDEHSGAKAGNINHALGVIDADVVAVLDADHVVTPGFLTNTLGYFEDPGLAVVQTPQDFYNLDSFEHDRNRSWFGRQRRSTRYNEERLFYRAIQPGKNRWGAAFWCGTNALVRVSALRSIGGVATETVTEDIHTTVRLHRAGWRTVYHNEVLAYGLAARTAGEYQAQRLRWGIGAMQLLRTERPLSGPGLTLPQRIAYASTLFGWFDAWRSLAYVTVPLLVMATGAVPIRAGATTFMAVFGTTFALQRFALGMLSRGYADQRMATLFDLMRMEVGLRATSTLLRPRPQRFRVTAKEGADQRQRIPAPTLLRALFVVSLVALAWFVATATGNTPLTYTVPPSAYGAAAWTVLNTVFLAMAIRRMQSDRYASDRRTGARLAVDLPCVLDGRPARMVDFSAGGALVEVPLGPRGAGPHRLALIWGDRQIVLAAEERVRLTSPSGSNDRIGLQFTPDQLADIGTLASALYAGRRVPSSPTAPETALAS